MTDPTDIVKSSSTAPTTSVTQEEATGTSMTLAQALQTVHEPEVIFLSVLVSRKDK